MRVFELIGPIMFGPSSSHTAGACRLSRAMWQIAGGKINKAELDLHGSFRAHEGGSVNKALVAGLLGFDTDDDRINQSHALMEQSGMDFSYGNVNIEGAHNNTVRYRIWADGIEFTATGASVGGGMIDVTEINGAKMSLTGDYNSLMVFCGCAEKTAQAVDKIFGEGNDEYTVETAVSEDKKTQIVLFKTSHPVTDDMVKRAGELEGTVYAARHLRFD